MNDIVLDVELVRDYLAGRLSDSETRAFEGRVARDPALLRSMEEMLRFREGLEVLLERGELDPLVSRSRKWTRWIVPVTAAAAFAAVALFIGRTLLAPPPLVAPSIASLRLPSTAPRAVVAQYSLAALRQSGSGPSLELPTSGPIELRVLAPGVLERSYRINLSRWDPAGSMRALASLEGLVPGPDGFLTIYLDAAGFSPGDYTVSAGSGVDAAASAPIAFRFVAGAKSSQR